MRSGRPRRGRTEHLRGFSCECRTMTVGGYALLMGSGRGRLKAFRGAPTITVEGFSPVLHPTTRGRGGGKGAKRRKRKRGGVKDYATWNYEAQSRRLTR